VTTQVVGYRRIKRQTHENLGMQPLAYPPFAVETSAYWLEVLPAAQAELERAGLWYDSINDYGPNWAEQRARVRARDRHRCTRCGAPEPADREHDVHHLVPFRVFGYVRGLNENYLQANQLENLVLVCRACHQRIETATSLRSGLDGLAYALVNLAPLHLMCDPSDLGVFATRGTPIGAAGVPAPAPRSAPKEDVDFYGGGETQPLPAESPAGTPQPGQTPRLYLFERTPAGLGFSAALYDLHEELLESARLLVEHCGCTQGCPACVGPVLEEQAWQLPTKELTLGLLRVATGQP
jgi:DEAD/DEAH box helicase domain-containing protein